MRGCRRWCWTVFDLAVSNAIRRPPRLQRHSGLPLVAIGLKFLPFRVFCLQAYATFPARADIATDLDWDGLTLRRAIAVPTFPLSPNRRFAPTALKDPNLAVAERDDFDRCSLGSFGL
jgi:hypothetical protein